MVNENIFALLNLSACKTSATGLWTVQSAGMPSVYRRIFKMLQFSSVKPSFFQFLSIYTLFSCNFLFYSNFSDIILPLQSSLTPNLPNCTDQFDSHQVFPSNAATIKSFLDKVDVLPSMQKPKKIWICCSDGKSYEMLCKPKV